MKRKHIFIISLSLIVGAVIIISISIISQCFYTVEPIEQAVVSRFGEYYKTRSPGFYLKIPFVDKVDKVKVDYLYKKEIGIKIITHGDNTKGWKTIDDLSQSDLRWIIEYKINNPVAYSFNVNNQNETIIEAFKSGLYQLLGNEISKEIIYKDKIIILNEAKKIIQNKLNYYQSGIEIQMIQLY